MRRVDNIAWAEGLGLESLRLGLRICAWLGYQSGLDIREIPGVASDPRIVAYGDACKRGGVFVGVDANGLPAWSGIARPVSSANDSEAWCAKARSSALLACLRVGERPPHGLRIAVHEMATDARIARTLRMPSATGYQPKPGDAALLKRAGGNPLLGGVGHVRTVIRFDGATYVGIGGNENDAFGIGQHPSADVVAWIET